MVLKIISLLLVVVLSGCATPGPDLDKPLIPIPEKQSDKPKEEKVWIEAKTSRIWVNPHVDENGDLIEGHYKNVIIEPGHWDIKADARKQ